MTDDVKSTAVEGAGSRRVPAFPEGEAEFPEMEPLAGPADLGHWVLTGLLWALVAVSGVFVVTGLIKTLRVIGEYYG